ncbi:MAG: methyltransferase [Mucilaginibacter sp.]|nr:methyltransferase [Mucilaginibacter sp.]MDB5016365.1 methyltransferase [Mucilaginibacter sp.]
MLSTLNPFLIPEAGVTDKTDYLEFDIKDNSDAIRDNAYYFDNPEWAEEYLIYCHRSEPFKSRWEAALGDVSQKIVVDIGCGPGNIFSTITDKPKLLIGVDVAPGSLKFAKKAGYLPVLADANKLPFKSGFADIVTLNAALHHCENMGAVLKEAARLVKPGGLLVTDHDPQLSAWNYKGLARLLWYMRLVWYKVIGHGFHKSSVQQKAALASEIHHKPGHGVTPAFFKNVLEPLNFSVDLYPHNHEVGKDVFNGITGNVALKYKIGHLLSGRNPSSKTSALSIMCVARKFNEVQ